MNPLVRRRLPVTLLLLLALLVPMAGPAAAGPTKKANATVMSRNVYLGADLLPVIAAPPENLFAAATAVWQQAQATRFEERADALAHEILTTKPDLIGLQEVALWRSDTPADGPATPAGTVELDFLQILLDALAERGLDYRVAAAVENFDAEVPTLLGYDMRFTDRGVILVREGVTTSNPQSGNFSVALPLPMPGDPTATIEATRGWSSIDAEIRGRTFRFINTHLEAYGPDEVRMAQLAELLAGPAATTLPTVLVGDLNATPDTAVYALARQAGFVDAWDRPRPGWTCCQDEDVANPTSELDERIDYVLYRGFVGTAVHVIGDKRGDRTPSGLWPSDHAGVVARLQLR